VHPRFVSELLELALHRLQPGTLRPRLTPDFAAETFADSGGDSAQ